MMFLNMDDIFEKGWKQASEIFGSPLGTHIGRKYVGDVKDEITKLENSINNSPRRTLPLDRFQGDIFEDWNTGTYNVRAAAAGTKFRVVAPHTPKKNAPDMIVMKGNKVVDLYGAKSYKNAAKGANALAELDPVTRIPRYQDQIPIVPTDKLVETKRAATRRAQWDQQTRPDVAESYSRTAEKLTDRIETDDGIQSKPVIRKQLDHMAKDGQEQKFSAEKYGVTLENEITWSYIHRRGVKAGYTAAVITTAMELTPEIIKAIDYLVKNEEIDIDHIKKMGKTTLSASCEGFIRGYVSCILTSACLSGKLGEQLRTVDPGVVAIVTVMVIDIAKSSYRVAMGEISAKEMGYNIAKDTIIAISGYAGGVLGQIILDEIPVIGYMIGSMLGSCLAGITLNLGEKFMIAICVDTGFACFGLVDQDYVLPVDVLRNMGLDITKIPDIDINQIQINQTTIKQIEVKEKDLNILELTVVRRGVIGVRKIGYI